MQAHRPSLTLAPGWYVPCVTPQLPVVPIPGATAIATLLSASGFSGDQFVFLGFPPSSGAARARWFHELATETRVALFFEAPHRAKRTLEELLYYVKRPIIVGRELTKVNEQLVKYKIT